MRVEFDADSCVSFHQYVPEWDAITEGDGGKIEIEGALEDDSVYERTISEEETEAALAAAAACPVNAIAIYDGDERLDS